MKLISNMTAEDGALIAIQTVGPDGKTTFHPVAVVEGADGSEILIAVLAVTGKNPGSINEGKVVHDSLCAIAPAADAYPELRAKLASIE